MTNTTKRRDFLQLGTVISAGLAAGAFTTASLAAQPKTMSKDSFLGRFDTRLGTDEIRQLMVGNTMEGVTFKGQEYIAFVNEDGTVDKMVGDRRETGTWEIKDNGIAFQFPTLANGGRFFLEIYHHKNGELYKGWSVDENRWVWFVTEPGKASELA